MHILDRLCGSGRPASPICPRSARSALFSAAQRSRDQREPWDRGAVVSSAAAGLAVSPEALLESLFADLSAERRVALPSPLPAPAELARRANLAMAQGFLQRSSRVTLEVHGSARGVVRQILLRRLLCTVHPRRTQGSATIDISGPYSLFKRTTLYGRALAALVPLGSDPRAGAAPSGRPSDLSRLRDPSSTRPDATRAAGDRRILDASLLADQARASSRGPSPGPDPVRRRLAELHERCMGRAPARRPLQASHRCPRTSRQDRGDARFEGSRPAMRGRPRARPRSPRESPPFRRGLPPPRGRSRGAAPWHLRLRPSTGCAARSRRFADISRSDILAP